MKWMWIVLKLDSWWSLQLHSTDGKREKTKAYWLFSWVSSFIRTSFFVFSSVYVNQCKHHWTFQSQTSNFKLIFDRYCVDDVFSDQRRLAHLHISFSKDSFLSFSVIFVLLIERSHIQWSFNYLTSTQLKRSKRDERFLEK